MIFCVIPEELAPALYERLERYYDDDPNVQVIIDRRRGERRARHGGERRESRVRRDRRRARVPGEFPPLEASDAA